VAKDFEENLTDVELNSSSLRATTKNARPVYLLLLRRRRFVCYMIILAITVAVILLYMSGLSTLVISYERKHTTGKGGDELRLWNSVLRSSSSTTSNNYSWFRPSTTSHLSRGKDLASSELRGLLSSPDQSIFLMITSDVHGHVRRTCRSESVCYPGAASIASVVRTVRQHSSGGMSLLIDAGDALFGAGDGVDEMIVGDVMNLLGYDATVLGNHDFDIGDQRLSNFAEKANFPILASNAEGLGSNVQKHLRVNLGHGVFLCLVGVTTAEANPLMGAGVTIRPEVESVLAYSLQLRGDGICQHIVVVSHAGIKVDQEIALHTTVVDAVIGGHSHVMTGVPADAAPESAEFGRVLSKNLPFPFRLNSTSAPIAHVGSYGRYMGLLRLNFAGSKLMAVEGSLIPLDRRYGVYPDAEVGQWLTNRMTSASNSTIKKVNSAIRIVLEESVGKNDACGFVCRKEECLLGNLVTDAMRSCVLNGSCSAFSNHLPVVALLESGTLRDCASTHDTEDFASILPWPNKLILLTVSGSTLIAMLEHGVNSREENNGAFLQVSGLTYHYEYDERAKVTNVSIANQTEHPNARLNQRKQGGQNEVFMAMGSPTCCSLPAIDSSSEPLRNDTLYHLVVTDWFAAGGDGYGPFVASSQNSTMTNVPLLDVIMQYSKRSPMVNLGGRSCPINQPTSSARSLSSLSSLSFMLHVVMSNSLFIRFLDFM
jgi:2',3'-cyclic-nucleotide 2'-phosphodiesterase (5'-nucleotidase family)